MKKYFLAGLILLAINTFIVAQSNPKSIQTGQIITVLSEVFREEKEIQVYLPEGYGKTDLKFPVLYVLDGQRYFLNGIAFQQNLTFQKICPEFIVVGIPTDARKRRRLFARDSEKFIQFLQRELIPAIDRDYRTLNERVYFGWEMAAGLGIQIFAKSPQLFNAYLLSSPTYVTEERQQAVETLLSEAESLDNSLYVTLGEVETWSSESMESLDNIFDQNPQENLEWRYDLLANENHYTTPLITINEGLKSFFGDYAPLRFYTLKEFSAFGGMEALRLHYEKRGRRYGLSPVIHVDTKHYLLLQAMNEDNFDVFQQLGEEFDVIPFVQAYYRRDDWLEKYASYFLDNDDTDSALKILESGITKFPNSSKLYNARGLSLQANGEIEKARLSYQRAIDIATKRNESALETYKKNLRSL